MPLHTTQAIVIRSFNYGESDKILTFFTRDFGKLKGIAKGARRSKKRFQNALGLFSHLRLIFFDREGMGLVRVESGDLLHAFPNLREDLKRIYFGNYYLELINEMAGEREVHPEAFDHVLSFLTQLDREPPREDQLRIFEIRMLALFGYRPHLSRCGSCKRGWEELRNEANTFFSLEQGTLLCGQCSKRGEALLPLSLGTARLIDLIAQSDLDHLNRIRFTAQALAESRGLLPRFISHHIGKELKSLKALQDLGGPS
ncbi:MAG: DNA repair protein RecO [Desulfobacterota bacterium]|nr:DNA repair protein RecO [Thermodesulfobacteriota bacterium]